MEHQLCFKLSFLSFTSEVFNKILLYTPVFNMMMGLLLNFRFATAPFQVYSNQLNEAMPVNVLPLAVTSKFVPGKQTLT